MKSSALKASVGILVFLILIVTVVSVLRPIYRKVSGAIRIYEQKFMAAAELKTGMKFSYKSLSPSILSRVFIRGIVVRDALSGEEILVVRKASLSYSLSKILRGEVSDAFSKLSIGDVTLNLASEKCAMLASRFGVAGGDSRSESQLSRSQAVHAAFARVASAIPFDVQVKNVKASYSSGGDLYSAEIRRCSIRRNVGAASLFVRTRGSFFARLGALGGNSAGFTFMADGNLLESFSGSALKLRLDDLSGADYSVRRLEFLLNCKGPVVAVRSSEHFYPFSAYASLNLDTLSFSSIARMEKFDPFQVAKVPKGSGLSKWLKGTIITTESACDIDFPSGQILWTSKSDVQLSKAICSGGERIWFDAAGRGGDVSLAYLNADGAMAKFSYEGSFNIPKIQPTGSMRLDYYVYPLNGNRISGDIYFSALDRGFMLFVPELRFGEQVYTAFQAESFISPRTIELSVEASDYSHPEYEVPGRLQATGILSLGDNPYLQASANLESFFVATGIRTGAFFGDFGGTHYIESLVPKFEPYITSLEVYFATDFKNFSYNSPSLLMASTQRERQVVFLSFDGSGTSVKASKIEVVYGNNSLSAVGEYDFSWLEKQMAFSSDFTFNSIPYSVAGTYEIGKWISVTGTYGMNLFATFGDAVSGTLSFEEFPLSYGNYMAAFSLDTSFYVPQSYGWAVTVNDFEIYELSSNFRARPRISLQGSIDENGFIASAISYVDSLSRLDGTGCLLWNVNDGIFDGANISIGMESRRSKESLSISGEVTNPTRGELTAENLRGNFYFNSEAKAENFLAARLLRGQSEANTISADIAASGTFENPYLSVKVRDSSVALAGSPLRASVSASYMEDVVSVSEGNFEWRNFALSALEGGVDMRSFSGSASFSAGAEFGSRDLGGKFALSLQNLSMQEGEGVPESYSVELDWTEGLGDLREKHVPAAITFIRSPGRFDIMTNDVVGAYGEYLDDGTVGISVRRSKPLHFDLSGRIKDGDMSLALDGFYFDISRIASLINTDTFSVYRAVARGDLSLTGSVQNPSAQGRIVVSGAEFNLPTFIPDRFTAHEIPVEFNPGEISIPDTMLRIRGTQLSMNSVCYIERWSPSYFEVNLETQGGRGLPVDARHGIFRVKGSASVSASLMVEDNTVTLTGALGLSKSDITVSMNDLAQQNLSISQNVIRTRMKPKEASNPFEDMDFIIDLDLMVGKKVQVDINPLLRGLIAPSTPISLDVDTAAGTWSLNGDIVLRGGEVTYLSRSFYLKEGRLVLNESNNNFDPLVTVRAETREHDSNGDSVTIMLQAQQQHVSNFRAAISSRPPRSESELMEILGQVISADSTSVGNLLVTGLDYGVQMTVLRKIETALRDLCNFDIFSIRTTVVQNSIMQGLNMNRNAGNDSVISNLFDNSTVYIGKYFGSDIYADALMHWSYDKTKVKANESAGAGLVFQPEIGLEFDAPFANIRWNFAPDLTELQQSWTQATSVTLSWRLSF